MWTVAGWTGPPIPFRSPTGEYRAACSGSTLTSDEEFHSCERSDRILRAVLGETPQKTVLRFAPMLILVLVVAALASVLD